MRIGMVTDTYLPRINGVSRSIERFTDKLLQLGHDVFVFAPSYGSQQEVDERIWRFPSKSSWNNAEDRSVLVRHRSAKTLMQQVKALQLDIIHTHTPFELGHLFLKYAKREHIPCVHTYHTWFDAYVEHYAKPVPVRLAKFMMRTMTTRFSNQHQAVIAPSQAMKGVLLSYGIKTSIHTIATGADKCIVKKEVLRQIKTRFRLQKKTPLLLIAGRIAYEKNQCFLMDVCKRVMLSIPTARIIVAGDGPALATLRKCVTSRNLQKHVLFSGWVDQETMAGLYELSTVHLIASKTETQGMVITEAMASGLVTVGIPALGTDEMLRHGGILADDNVDDFAEKVIHLLDDQEYRSKQEAKVSLGAEQYTMNHCTTRLEELYKLLSG